MRFASFLAPNVYSAYAAIVQHIGLHLHQPVELLVADTHEQYEALAPDVAFVCGLPYVLMREQGLAIEPLCAPVLRGARYQQRPIYFSDVIVRHDSPFSAFEDLRGCSWAYNEQVSQSGYGITRHTLLQMGETSGFFSQVVNAGWHQRAIVGVAEGVYDATAIDSQVLAIELRAQPHLARQIKIIDSLGPSTIQPVVVRADLPAAMKASLRAAFLALHQDAGLQTVLHAAQFARFVPIADSDYADIRAMWQAAQAADFIVLR